MGRVRDDRPRSSSGRPGGEGYVSIAPMSENSLGRMVLDAAERHSGAAIRFPRDGTWHEWSFAELGTAVRELARGLVALGLEPGDRVALLGETRPGVDARRRRDRWPPACVVVPVYQTNSPEECRYVLDHSGARAVIVENAGQLAKIEAVRDQLPGLEHVISDGCRPAARRRSPTCGRRAGEVDEAELDDAARGGRHRRRGHDRLHVRHHRPAQGLHAHAPQRARHRRGVRQQVGLQAGRRRCSCSCRSRTRSRAWCRWSRSRSAARSRSGAATRASSWTTSAPRAPTHFPSVPRVFEKIHARVLARGSEGSAVKQRLFAWAIATGRKARPAHARAGPPRPLLQAQYALADRLVLSQGPRAVRRPARAGADRRGADPARGARVPRRLRDHRARGLRHDRDVRRGDAQPAARPALRHRRPGAAGLDGRDRRGRRDPARRAERLPGLPPQRGGDAPRRSTATLVRTGDLGELEDGFLRITGRKKDLIITSSGKNISPDQHRERAARVALDLAGGRPRRQPLLPRGAAHARRRRGAGAGRGARHRRRRGARWPPTTSACASGSQQEVDQANAQFARIEQVKRFAVLEARTSARRPAS